MPRPEPHGFTKFVLSIGVFLCVAAFVVPALILRDTDVLLVSERELNELTPLGETEIHDRQQMARDLGGAAPYVGLILLASGLALIRYGLPRLRQQEDKEEAKTSMEIGKLEAELEPQSEEEEQAELAATVEEDARPVASGPSAPRTGMQSPPSASAPVRRDVMNRAREIEQRVFEHLGKIAPPEYELKTRVRVAGEPKLLLDGILVSTIEQRPDVLVEIKLGSSYLGRNINNRIADILWRWTIYKNRLGRPAVGWLILVLEEPLSAAVRDQIADRVSELGAEIRLTTIVPEEIERLTLPVG